MTDPTEALASPTPPPMIARATVVDMTTRDYFATAALQGVIAAHSGETALPDAKKAAKWSREFADALLFELHNNPFPG